MSRAAGFSLVEMAVALVILGFLLGGLAMPLRTAVEQGRRDATRRQIDEAIEALIGFAAARGYLPCPAEPTSGGEESRTAAAPTAPCALRHGFVPAVALGLQGPVNEDGLLLDGWNNPLRYSVTHADADGDGVWDFTGAGEMADVGMADLSATLRICGQAACGSVRAEKIPAVIYSLGRHAAFTSADELENGGEATVAGGPSGREYGVGNDANFVATFYNDVPGAEFDDIVQWLSPNILFARLVAAGRLP